MSKRHIAVCSPALLAREVGRAAIGLNQFALLPVLASADQRYLTWQHWLKAAGIENVDMRGGFSSRASEQKRAN
jgi:LysR family glycine cleavage system transcriptional activator